jgi:hypothetical protein
MLEKPGFQALMEETVKVTRLTKVMSGYQFGSSLFQVGKVGRCSFPAMR